jgi:hypothetical protein
VVEKSLSSFVLGELEDRFPPHIFLNSCGFGFLCIVSTGRLSAQRRDREGEGGGERVREREGMTCGGLASLHGRL